MKLYKFTRIMKGKLHQFFYLPWSFYIRIFPPVIEPVYYSPPLRQKLLSTIKLIAPHLSHLRSDEISRELWQRNQNNRCQGEYKALLPFLKKIVPVKILDIGPGLGRSMVYFQKKMEWQNAEFIAYEGDGTKTKYSIMGERSNKSFCGNIKMLKNCLSFNGLKNYSIINGRIKPLSSLRIKFDFIYSFYAVGFHWSLEYFFNDIFALMNKNGVAVFTVPENFIPFPALKKTHWKIIEYHTQLMPLDITYLLVLSKSSDLI